MAVVCSVAAAQLINNQNLPAINLAMSTTPGASASFSISVWIKADWGSTSNVRGRRSFVGLYGPSPAPTSALQIGASVGNGDICAWTWGGGLIASSPADFMVPYNNQWINVGYTYDGTNHLSYLNGQFLGATTTAQLAGNLQMVCINGYPTGGAGETDTHEVDSYSLYNRVLSAGEMQTIYSAFGGRHGIIQGQIAGYEFDEGIQGATASAVLDVSGRGSTLLLVGAGTTPKYTYVDTVANSLLRPMVAS